MKSDRKFNSEDAEYFTSSSKKVKEHTTDLTAYQIRKIAEELVHQKIDHKTILGYVSSINNNITFCKYDRINEVFVRYKDEKILEAKFKPLREYNGDNVCEYYDELIE